MDQIRAAGRVGMSPETWENTTPAAFNAYIQGYLDSEKERQEAQRVNAYNLAIMVRAAVGAKRMPDYKEFFPGNSGEMSDEAMYSTVVAINKALGGSVDGE